MKLPKSLFVLSIFSTALVFFNRLESYSWHSICLKERMKSLLLIFSLISLNHSWAKDLNESRPLRLDLSLLSAPLTIGEFSEECEEKKLSFEIETTSFYDNTPSGVLTNYGTIPLSALTGVTEILTTRGPGDESLQEYLEEYTEVVYRDNPRFNQGIKSNATHLLKMLEIYHDGTIDDAYKYIEENLSSVSTNQKISFLSNFLRELYEKYDNESLNNSFADFNDEDLLKSLNVEARNTADKDDHKAGVCRHMHLMALTMARKMGLQQSYAVSYTSGMGYHLNLYINNPDNPREVYRMDYGSVIKQRDVHGNHALMLDRNNALAGIGTHFWGEKHNPIFFQPSQKGLLFNDLSGGSNKDFSTSMQSERRMISSSYKMTPSKTVRAAYAAIPNDGNEHIYALSLQHQKKPKQGRYFKYGVGLYGASRTANQTTTFMEKDMRIVVAPKYQEVGMFGRAELGSLNRLLDNENIIIQTDNKLVLRTQLFHSTYEESASAKRGLSFASVKMSNVLADGNGQLISTTSAKHKPSHTKVTIGADISGQVSDINSTSGVALYPRRLFARVHSSIPVGLNAIVSLDTGIDHFPLDGDHSVISTSEVRLSTNKGRDKTGIKLLYPLNKSPSFLYGSRPTIIGNAQYHLIDDTLILGATAHYSPQEFYEIMLNPNFSDQPGDYQVDSESEKLPSSIIPSEETSTQPYKVRQRVPADYGFGLNLKLHY